MLKKYDKYKDSGVKWLGEIPCCWKLVKTGRMFRNTKEIVGKKSNSTQRLALTLNGVIKRDINDAEGLQPEQFDSYQYLRKNQLVFKLIDLENVNTSRVGLCPFEEGMVSPAYIVLYNNSDDNRYYHYYFLSLWHNEIFNHLGGDGVRSALNSKDLLNIPTFALSIEEQQTIANYLDKKCSDIDNTIETEKSIIEKLKEYKQSIITETVTKGLDKSVELKDSGVKWIGKIPIKWRVVKLKVITQNIGDGLHGTPKYSDTGEFFFINGNNIGGRFLSIKEDTAKLSKEEARKYFIELNSRTILISLNGTIGNTSRYNQEKIILSKSAGYINLKSNINIDFVEYWLHSDCVKLCFELSFSGTTIKNLSLETLRNLYIVFPTQQEQSKIANYLDKKCYQIDETIEKKEQLIEKLTEYKKSLIYECVTGKRRV